jgi:hypothetical protein
MHFFILKIGRLKDLLHANNKINSFFLSHELAFKFKNSDCTNKIVTYCIKSALGSVQLLS